jgi:Putative auto-transporter adhesin, head GIN domain
MSASRRSLLAATGAGLLLGPGRAFAWGDAVKGSGVAATQRRDVGTFNAVSPGAPVSVVLRAAARESIEIVGDDNILPLIETRVRGSGARRSLQIDLPARAQIDPRIPLIVTVDYVGLETIALGGSGHITGDAMKAVKLDASVGGSGSISLTRVSASELSIAIGGSGAFRSDGRTGKLALSIGGSGRCDAERLIADDVSVNLAGSGKARVHADRSLRASIVGSGDLSYSGAATPSVTSVGSGQVKRI